ncbi:phosphonate ABC transporter, permease protein PhnE [Ilumatobacter nonamiensis]|uniref:phosphonate ABC transporter, permease protein PhnE n=1 Tax=Ilumatobacter nonamiensis TaxID=467093 RepID=UPI00034C368C|nr:phosphonate ABC transporter, permease protein PhnE [Ilumatobacter nonamiensis]
MRTDLSRGAPVRATDLSAKDWPQLPKPPRQVFKWVATTIIAAIVLWSFIGLDAKWSRLLDAPADLYTLGRLMFSQMEASEIRPLIGKMWESISIAWMGTLIAAIFAVPLSFFAAENLVGRPVAWIIRQVLNLLRAIPEIIIALAFIPVFGLTPMAGVLAIGVGSIGTLGKLFYEIIEGIERGPIEATDAVGASRSQRLRWGVLPQVTPELTSFILYRFEVNIRASAILGVLGVGGIGTDLTQAIRFKEWGTAGLALIIVVVGTIAVDTVSGLVRRRIVRGPGASSDGGSFEAHEAELIAESVND